GSLWAGTPGAGLYRVTGNNVTHFTTANGLSDNSVLALASDSLGAIWAGTGSGGLHRFEGASSKYFGTEAGLPERAILTIQPANGGGIWLGFENGDVFRGQEGTFRSMLEHAAFSGNAIRALH